MSGSDAIADPTQHPAMLRFAAAVRALYGDRVDRIVLYGSRARGDAREDSDWDVAVFLRGHENLRAESEKLGDVTLAILLDSNVDIVPIVLAAESYNDRTAFLREVRREGVDLMPAKTRAHLSGLEPHGFDTDSQPTPEVVGLIKRGRMALDCAAEILTKTELYAVSARESYIAVLWAVRAVLLHRTDRVVKGHAGPRLEIGRLAREDHRIGEQFVAFLADGLNIMVATDYLPSRRPELTREQSELKLATATCLVAHAEWLLAHSEPPPASSNIELNS